MDELQQAPKTKPILLILLIIVTCLSSLTSAWLFYQNLQLQKQISQLQTQPSPSPAETPLPSVDPTGNWKTYTNNFYHLEFKYPNNYSLNENADKIEINSPLSECNPALVFNVEEYKQMHEVQIIIKKRYGSLEKILEEEGGKNYGWEDKSFNDKKGYSIAVGAEMITPYTRFLVEGYPVETLDIQAYVFANDDQGRCIPKLDSGNASIVSNQILSTFKFLGQNSQTSSCTPKFKVESGPELTASEAYSQKCYEAKTKDECEKVDIYRESTQNFGDSDGIPDCSWTESK